MEIETAKPRWRGRLHQVAFFVSLPLGGVLLAAAQTTVERVAGGIYAFALSGLYAASSAFHRLNWGPRAWAIMRRVDHSMIYVLIAGTYTPYALLVLEPPWSTTVLAIVWAGALTGVALRILTRRFEALRQTLYLALGWTALFTLPLMIGRMEPWMIALMFAGGIFYTVGAILFRLRKPDPDPAVFGYHEVWHSMVIGGSVCHYALVLSLLLR